MLGYQRLFIEGLELDLLYLPLAIFIVAGMLLFLRISQKLYRIGNRGAALRFGLFSFAAVFAGIVAMFSDIFESIGLFYLVLGFMAASGLMLLLSGPSGLQALSRSSQKS